MKELKVSHFWELINDETSDDNACDHLKFRYQNKTLDNTDDVIH